MRRNDSEAAALQVLLEPSADRRPAPRVEIRQRLVEKPKARCRDTHASKTRTPPLARRQKPDLSALDFL
jgi:hypothetical protein